MPYLTLWIREALSLSSPFFFFFLLFRAAPAVYGGFPARGQIGAVASSLRRSTSNSGSEPRLGPASQLTEKLDP